MDPQATGTTTPCKPKQDVEKDVRDMHVLVLLLEIRLQKGQKSNFVQGIVVQITIDRVSCFVMFLALILQGTCLPG